MLFVKRSSNIQYYMDYSKIIFKTGPIHVFLFIILYVFPYKVFFSVAIIEIFFMFVYNFPLLSYTYYMLLFRLFNNSLTRHPVACVSALAKAKCLFRDLVSAAAAAAANVLFYSVSPRAPQIDLPSALWHFRE